MNIGLIISLLIVLAAFVCIILAGMEIIPNNNITVGFLWLSMIIGIILTSFSIELPGN